MDQQQKNKEFIINYLTALAGGVPKTRAIMEKYISDESLISHIEFFEAAFPLYEVYIEEMTAEDNRVIVQARMKGTHLGDLSGLPPTNKKVDFPFMIKYEIENNMIVRHWLLADQMELMQQLGVVPEALAAH